MLTFVNSKSSLNTMTMSTDQDMVLGGFADSSIRVYDTKSSNLKKTDELIGHSGPVYAVNIWQHESMMVSCSADGTIRLWSLELMSNLAAFSGHMLPVWDVSFAPNRGYYFASAGADKTARLWNVERNIPLRIMCGHSSDVEVVQWHPNCQSFATGSSDHTVILWDVSTGTSVRVFQGHETAVSLFLVHCHQARA